MNGADAKQWQAFSGSHVRRIKRASSGKVIVEWNASWEPSCNINPKLIKEYQTEKLKREQLLELCEWTFYERRLSNIVSNALDN